MIPRPPLAVSLAGLTPAAEAPWSGSPRAAIEWAAGAGFRSVRIDGAVLRARELDRSARRDLASLLKRLSLSCSGIELWIPPTHFSDSARSERALDAALGAAELAADLRTLLGVMALPTVAIAFPAKGAETAVRRLAERGTAVGVVFADHAFPVSDLSEAIAREPGGSVGIGVDPAAILMGGGNPATEASRAGQALAGARLSDASSLGRVPPGSGRLDELAYLVAVQTAAYNGEVTLDLRGLADQDRAARETIARWPAP